MCCVLARTISYWVASGRTFRTVVCTGITNVVIGASLQTYVGDNSMIPPYPYAPHHKVYGPEQEFALDLSSIA